MNQFAFQQPALLLTLLLLLPIGVLLAYARRRKGKVILEMGMAKMNRLQDARKRWLVQDALRLIALLLVFVALARPGYDPRRYSVSKSGRDVIFALDVSQSMLAEDSYPSRLEAARQGIRDALDSFSSERVALVLYAGSASIQCPLTHDYDFIRYMLDQANTRTVDFGGTTLQSALEKTVDSVINSDRKGMHDLVVLTDGENHTPISDKHAALVREHELGLLLIGIGDLSSGSRIPVMVPDTKTPGELTRQYLKYKGEVVTTRLNEAGLTDLANQVEMAAYVRAGTDSFDLAGLYTSFAMDKPAMGGDSTDTYVVYKEAAFPLLILALLLLLVSEVRLSIGKARQLGSNSARGQKIAAASVLFMICAISAISPQMSSLLIAQNTDAEDAISLADELMDLPPITSESELRSRFQEAANHQNEKRYPNALAIYAHITQSPAQLVTRERQAVITLNQGLCQLAQSEQSSQEPRSALSYAMQAQQSFLNAIRLNPKLKRAALRLDPVAKLITAYRQQIEEDEKEEREQQEMMQKLIDRLTELLKQQVALHEKVPGRKPQPRGKRGTPAPKPVSQPANAAISSKKFSKAQSALHVTGKDIELAMKTLDDELTRKMLADINVEGGPAASISILQEPRKLMREAVEAQSKAADRLKQWSTWTDARNQQQIAIARIREILEQLAGSGEGESEDGDWDEDYDEDWDMMDEAEGESQNSSMSGRGDFAGGAAMQALPVPNYSVEDILQAEKGSLQFRQQQRAKQNKGKLEKDW